MKCIIGLGNPEPKYSLTRHNIGKDFLNSFVLYLQNSGNPDINWKFNKYINCEVFEVGKDFVLIKPMLFMNELGIDVKKAVNFYEILDEHLMIAYDELDLLAGEYKIAFAKGSHIHNGILSIKEYLQHENFWHLRIGVRDENIAMSVQKAGLDPAKYVLAKCQTADSKKISETIKNSIIPDSIAWLSKNQ